MAKYKLSDIPVYNTDLRGSVVTAAGGTFSFQTAKLNPGQYYKLVKAVAHTTPPTPIDLTAVAFTGTRFKLYKGPVNPLNLIDCGDNANVHSSEPLEIVLRPGDFLTFQFLDLAAVTDAVSYGVAICEVLNIDAN